MNDACGATAYSQQIFPASHFQNLTLRWHRPVRIEVLKHEHIFFRLVTHVVESLVLVMLQIHSGAHVLAADMVRFDEIGAVDGAAVADCERVVLNGVGQGPPDAREPD